MINTKELVSNYADSKSAYNNRTFGLRDDEWDDEHYENDEGDYYKVLDEQEDYVEYNSDDNNVYDQLEYLEELSLPSDMEFVDGKFIPDYDYCKTRESFYINKSELEKLKTARHDDRYYVTHNVLMKFLPDCVVGIIDEYMSKSAYFDQLYSLIKMDCFTDCAKIAMMQKYTDGVICSGELYSSMTSIRGITLESRKELYVIYYDKGDRMMDTWIHGGERYTVKDSSVVNFHSLGVNMFPVWHGMHDPRMNKLCLSSVDEIEHMWDYDEEYNEYLEQYREVRC